MRRQLSGLAIALLMGVARFAQAAPCAVSDTTLCLSASRFTASVHWKDSNGRTGDGHAIAITADTGYFWFFSASNIELVVKVLDARTVNGKYWVFFGALSNVEYTLTVTDTVTGAQKQYVNPSGQFASVGDTKAFDPNGPAGAVVETVEGSFAPPESVAAVQRLIDGAATKATADFTPCPSAPNDLWLDGCRFRLHVDWQANGRNGEGTGVQLTDNTGYFWFFSDTNVELMVKVLDARPVNGNIWVFFGALSNVQYTLTVYDTLTGTERVYTNPNGTFASIGDTKAFAGGKSVTAVKDTTKAVSQEIDAAGGTITATGADGTVYTLVVAANSVFFPTVITMTPLDHIDGFPFLGGLRGGVQLEPEGLILFNGGTLTIAPTTAIPPEELLPFAYDGAGENFILHPVIPNVPGVQIPISHFSGYGAGDGGPTDASNQSGIDPTGLLAPYIQQAAEIQAQERSHQLDPTTGNAQLVQILEDAFDQVILPTLQSIKDCDPDAVRSAVLMLFEWGHEAGFFIGQEAYEGRYVSALQEIKRIVLDCIDKAFQKCVSQNDTGQVRLMMALGRILDLLGTINDDEWSQIFDKVERCLRFEVDFDSTIEVETGPVTFEQKVQAAVPVRMTASQSAFYFEGSDTLEFVMATLSPGENNPCHYDPSDTENSIFDVQKLVPGGPERDAYDVRMAYDPGTPQENDHQICPTIGEQDTGFYPLWSSEYASMHGDEMTATTPPIYIAGQWTTILYGNYVAKKTYERTISLNGEPATESTHIFLKHTPDAP